MTPESPPEHLVALVDEFLATFPEGAEIATDESCYGAGLCADASGDLVEYAAECHGWRGWVVAWITSRTVAPWVTKVNPHPSYPSDVLEGHAVALFGEWVVDLTARQFAPSLPFPFYWRVS